MPPLTWRNVESPDFRNSLDGLRIASGAIDRAVSGVSTGLTKFDEDRRKDAESTILSNSLNYTTPEELRAAQQSGALFQGVNRSLLGREAVAALDTRGTSMLNQAVTQQSLDTARQADPLRIEGMRQTNRAADQTYNQNERLNPIAVEQAQANVGLARANTAGVNANTAGTLQRNQHAGEQFGWTRTDRDEGRAGEAAAVAALRQSTSMEDAQAALEADTTLSPPARARAIAALPSLMGAAGLNNPAGVAPGTAAPGAAPNRAGGAPAAIGAAVGSANAPGTFAATIPSEFPQSRAYAPSILRRTGPLREGTNEEIADQLLPALITQESSGDDSAVSPRGARGRMQLMPDTARELERTLGMQPGETDRNPEANQRAGRAYLVQLLNKYQGNAEHALTAYIAGPRRVDQWIAANAARGEQRAAATQAQIGAEARIAQNLAPGIAAQYPALMASTRTRAEVIQELRQPNGLFAGVDPDLVAERLDHIQQRLGPQGNTAIAAALLAQYGTHSQSGWDRATTLGRVGITLNEEGLTNEINAIRNETRLQGSRGNQATAAIAQAIETAKANEEQAYAALQRQRAAAEQRSGVARTLSTYEARYRRAAEALERATRAANRPDHRPQWQPTSEQPGPAAAASIASAANAPAAPARPRLAVPTPNQPTRQDYLMERLLSDER